MAKTNEVGFVEEHIEKLILAASVVLCLFAVYYWGLSSPKEVQIGRTAFDVVSPDVVDKKLYEMAESYKQQIDRKPLKPSAALLPWQNVMKRLREQPFPADVRIAETGLARAPLFMPTGGAGIEKPTFKQIQLAIPSFIKRPKVAGGRQLIKRQTDADTLVVHMVGSYPLVKLENEWRNILLTYDVGPFEGKPILYDIIVERREVLPGGQYGKPVKATCSYIDDRQYSRTVILPVYDGSNAKKVRAAIVQLADARQQEIIAWPDFWDVWSSGDSAGWATWRELLPWNAREIIEPVEEKKKPTRRIIRPVRRTAVGIDRRRGNVAGMPGGAMPPGAIPPGMLVQNMRVNGRAANPRVTNTRIPVTRAGAERARAAMSAGVAGAKERTITPGVLDICFHDMQVDVAKKYQYRVTLRFVNPLLTYNNAVHDEHPEDASVGIVTGPASEWSDVVSIPNQTEFALTGKGKSRGGKSYVTMTVFTQAMGQWVMQKFNVRPGEMIGGKETKKLINPGNRMKMTREVEFSTNAIVLDVDYSSQVARDSFKTAERIVYFEGGKLKSKLRVRRLDKASEERVRYNELTRMVEQAISAADALERTVREPGDE